MFTNARSVVSKMSVDDGSGTLTIEGLNFGNPDKVGWSRSTS